MRRAAVSVHTLTVALATLALLGCMSTGEHQNDESPSSQGSAQTGAEGEREKNKVERPAPTLTLDGDLAAALGEPLHGRDMGQPAELTDDAYEIVTEVWTDPGDIPVLQLRGPDGQNYNLPLEHTHVSAAVSGSVARVEVTQTYHNPFKDPIETTYLFPLPENSAVDAMRMVIGERVIAAEIKKRDEARKTYEEARDEGKTAALLEQERPNVFTQSVANIAPGEEIQVVVRYVQDLSYDAGWYEFVFPMVVGPRFTPGEPTGKAPTGTGWTPDTDQVGDASRVTPPIVGGGLRSGHDISLELLVDAGVPVSEFTAPTHDVASELRDDGRLELAIAEKESIPNRDFVMRYRVDKDEPQAALVSHITPDKGGFFTLVVQPPDVDVEKLVGDRELVFVVDVSGSMSGQPLAMSQDAMRMALRTLRPTDTFNVISFAGASKLLFDQARPANQANLVEAMAFVDSMRAGGGTQLADAITAALSPQTDGRNRYVVFMTDGYVSNEAQILAQTELYIDAIAEQGQTGRVFGFGVGSSVNRMLIEGLGDRGNGLSVVATTREDPAVAVNRILEKIDHPIITDVEIDWGSLPVDEVYPKVLPDLFASHPMTIHGRFTKTSGSAKITVRGKLDDGSTIELPVEVDLAALATASAASDPDALVPSTVQPTLWARARIDELERGLWFGDSEAESQITDTGLEFGIVTAFTSFVAVDHSRTVGDGDPMHINQPVDSPEGVDPTMAAPPVAVAAPSPMPQSKSDHKVKRKRPMVKKDAAPSRIRAVEAAPEPEPESADEPASRAFGSAAVAIGGLQSHQAESVFQAQRAALEACVASLGDSRSEITVTLTVDAEGKVTQVKIRGLDGHADVSSCIEKLVRAMTFDATGSQSTVRRTL